MIEPVPASAFHQGPSHWSIVRGLLAREHALGIIVYTCSVPERSGNALLGLMLLACAVLWSSTGGLLPTVPRCRFCSTVVESALLYVGAISVSNLLRLLLGQLSIGL